MDKQFEDLLIKLKEQDPYTDEELVRRAYDFCMSAHGSQLRASGELYFTHPMAVAQILTDFRLDHYTVITGLLHDTVEDTLVSLDDISHHFGPDIARLVDGVTKLSLLQLQSEHTKQAENLRKLVLAMSTDIRVLLVKLADRLHNMRTLHFISSDTKRKRIARETVDIYAPLAERMGMQQLKEELEDIAFGILNPDAKETVLGRLKFLYENAEYTVEAIIEDISKHLNGANLRGHVTGRQKTPYSIWKKMQTKRIAFEQLSDIMAFRVLVDSLYDVYQALGILHNVYLVLPNRFKDYVSTPKPNGYQSLHTGLIGPFNSRIEVQIRTKEMHQIAEFGVASHWQYKQNVSHDGKQYAWLRGLLEILEQTSDPEEFLEHTKLEMFQDRVFCFTPRGDLIQLPKGSTPIDFAYAVHSEIGDHMTSVKINGRMMPLRTVLNNGDQVEIVTSKSQMPSPAWERYAVTGKARSRIRRFIRSQRRREFVELGKSLLNRHFRHENLEFSDRILLNVCNHYDYNCMEELFAAVGEGLVTPGDVAKAAFSHQGIPQQEIKPEELSKHPRKKKTSPNGVSIEGLISGMAVHYAGCCHPLPGDKISGIIKTGRGVTIHTKDCETLKAFSQVERLLDLSWRPQIDPQEKFVGRLKATFLNRPGSLAAFSSTIAKQKSNIVNLKITHRTLDFWEVIIDLEVADLDHIYAILAALRTLTMVNSVERV